MKRESMVDMAAFFIQAGHQLVQVAMTANQ